MPFFIHQFAIPSIPSILKHVKFLKNMCQKQSIFSHNNPKHPLLTRSGVLQLEVLVLELVAVDRLATGAVSGGEVTTLEKR